LNYASFIEWVNPNIVKQQQNLLEAQIKNSYEV
jgi:hypothetical protein